MKKEYSVGNIVDINDVNKIKEQLFREEFIKGNIAVKASKEGWGIWEKEKKKIKKRITFKILTM